MQSDQVLGSLSFTVSRAMGNKFPLGPIKNVWEVGPYGFIEFYRTQYGTRTNLIGFKEDKSSWQQKETLEEAMLSVLPQKEQKVETTQLSAIPTLPFSGSSLNRIPETIA